MRFSRHYRRREVDVPRGKGGDFWARRARKEGSFGLWRWWRVEPDPLRFSIRFTQSQFPSERWLAPPPPPPPIGTSQSPAARKMNLLHRLASSPLHLLGRAPPALFSPSEAFVVPPSRRRRFGRRWSVSASVSSSAAAAAAEVDAEPVVAASEINGEDGALNGEDGKVVLPTNQTSERLLRIRHTVCHLPFSYRFSVYCYFCFRQPF